MKLEFHPEAETELIEQAAYYELQVPGLGERFEKSNVPLPSVTRSASGTRFSPGFTSFMLTTLTLAPLIGPSFRTSKTNELSLQLRNQVDRLSCDKSPACHEAKQ